MRWFDRLAAENGSGVFALTFVYALSVGLLIQWVVLPMLLPGIHAGHGLLAGGDWVVFHQEADLMAQRIQKMGWAAWELRPGGNAPIGIAAIVYAMTGIHQPWVVLPLNALLFALGAACLFLMFSGIAPPRVAFFASLPYVVFPSAAMLYGQIHKDVYSIAGSALIILVWVRFAARKPSSPGGTGGRILVTALGAFLIWLVRPYLIQVVLVASLSVVLVLAIQATLNRTGYDKRPVRWWLGLFACLGVLAVGASVPTGGAAGEGALAMPPPCPSTEDGAVANLVCRLNYARLGFAGQHHAGSNVDIGVNFRSLSDVAKYVPRALQIGLLAPFPDMWSAQGVMPGAGMMRRIAGVEMMIAYALLFGICLWFMCNRGLRGEGLLIVVQAVIPLLVLTLVVCNVGTLYRMRYGYWQLLLGLGAVGWGGCITALRQRAKRAGCVSPSSICPASQQR